MNSKNLPLRFAIGTRKSKEQSKYALFFNIVAFLIVLAAFSLLSCGVHEITAPISNIESESITLDPINLLQYSLETVLRMFIAVIFSLIFSLIYATIAAKCKRAEKILIPLLDVLQSVPILGYISFTVTIFLSLFPNSIFGAQCAAIFAIFTSQAWNMTFSFYQSLKTLPHELKDASYIFRMSDWQKFWRVELPYGIPGLVWNTAISMSGGWFFVVAAEVMTVGNVQITLPGIGSYIALALVDKNIHAIIYAILAMISVILLYDQFLLRPLITWADRFRYEMTASAPAPQSWVFTLFKKNLLIKKIFIPISYLLTYIVYLPIFNFSFPVVQKSSRFSKLSSLFNILWYMALCVLGGTIIYLLFSFLYHNIELKDIMTVFQLTMITMLRVVVLIILASMVWVPIGIYIGLHSKVAEFIQPIAQFLAAFPANLLFPIAVIVITRYDMNPNIWLSPLMIMGTQWYILFNVIAGTASIPTDLKEAARTFNVKKFLFLKKVILPAITPYYITGAITASGGAWNASIVAEVIHYGQTTIRAHGIGSYINEMTVNGDFHRIVLGIGAMSLCIVIFNHLFWQPIYEFSVKRFQL